MGQVYFTNIKIDINEEFILFYNKKITGNKTLGSCGIIMPVLVRPSDIYSHAVGLWFDSKSTKIR